MFNKELLKKYVAEYKENFQEIRFGKDREIYKWEAVEHFQRNWDVDAIDFAEMLKQSLFKTENLLTVGMFYARAMLLGLANKEPETVREMFRNLYDESKDLSQRVSKFMVQANELHKRNPGGQSHYQGTRAISVYLWLKYPEKYYIYQYAIYDTNVKVLEADYIIKANGKPESMLEGFKFYNEIRVALLDDKELVKLNLENGVDGYKDEKLNTLTVDVGFYIYKHNIGVDKISGVVEGVEEDIEEPKVMPKYPKNLILYGPPGTGKTYNAVNYAVAIIEEKTVKEVLAEKRENVLERYNNYKKNGLIEFCTFHQSYGYEEFIEGIKPKIENGNVLYKVQDGVFKGFCKEEQSKESRNKVFIIDEINRGNISKIFGELITLIEDNKRIGACEAMQVRLPYSGEKFGVPQNVYLLGTMNTADRSIALIDTALRRRFKFMEMQPNVELLNGIEVEGVKIKDMLEVINKRIELLYDREHTIGHSFFMGLSNASAIADLVEIFECNVIPLLKEYFYNDYERIAAVLGDDLNKNDANVNFILRENDYVKIPNSEIEVPPAYKFNSTVLEKPEAYKKIYE